MMIPTIDLALDEFVETRPFTDPVYLSQYKQTLSYMAAQVCVLLEYPYLSAQPPHIVFFHQPGNSDWFHRIMIAQPEGLRQQRALTIVGFFGHTRSDADTMLVQDFDKTLTAEIPAHPGLYSYSSMALEGANYANLVVFSDRAARDHWSTSQAHAQAVQQLSPHYYHTVTIVNGRLPEGIYQHHDLTLIRAKYYDYQCQPRWQAVRMLTAGIVDLEV